MSSPSFHVRRLFVGLVLCGSLPTLGQTISVGFGGNSGGPVTPDGVETIIQTVSPANIDGTVTSATFGWSAGPCPAAVEIKFFRPVARGNPTPAFTFLTARGPFDVPSGSPIPPASPPIIQTVALNPPVTLQAGDVIAITNLTSCGGPLFVMNFPSPLPPFGETALVVPGDVTTTVLVSAGTFEGPVIASAVGATTSLLMLGGRFQATLLATDPRTGHRTAGFPVFVSESQTTSSGYFSLPDFTGESTFPEIIIKMVDATGSEALGGDFWFFHAPLTDVDYTITVTDLTNRNVKTYTNAASIPGQLCGGVDTSAFPGP